MSRVARVPVHYPKGVSINITGNNIEIKGTKGVEHYQFHQDVSIEHKDDALYFMPKQDVENSLQQAGTAKAIVSSHIKGVTVGFERKLVLVGVGYKANVQGNKLVLILGYSHPINFTIPSEVKIECPTQTEVIIKGSNKHLIGQIAATIRGFRSPDPYKGKGVRYSDEVIILKETKKK